MMLTMVSMGGTVTIIIVALTIEQSETALNTYICCKFLWSHSQPFIVFSLVFVLVVETLVHSVLQRVDVSMSPWFPFLSNELKPFAICKAHFCDICLCVAQS